MTTVETVRRLLVDAAGESLCDACLAFACSVTFAEVHRVTEELVTSTSFQRRDRCVSCRRTVPAIAFTVKCIHCSRPVLPGEGGLEIDGDMFHAVCITRLATSEIIRISRKLTQRSRRLIENTQRRIREEGRWDSPRSSVQPKE